MNNETYMLRCLELAKQGFPGVMPNPAVGCVVVCDDKIIGEGFHRYFGDLHAEVNALNSVPDKNLLEKSTVYVNLEPCSHYGKTPPCADLLIQHKVKKVVVAIKDPNPLVAGRGIEKLRSAGIDVETGLLSVESAELNRRFLTFHQKNRPYIILKWAQTQDGFISDNKGNSKWISNDYSRQLVHKWRSEEQSILVGTTTAKIDNPELTTRDWPGNSPIRLVIDQKLNLPGTLHLFDQKVPTIVFNNIKNSDESNIRLFRIDFNKNIPEQILQQLFALNIQSVLIEGGANILNQFVEQNLWDDARVFIANKIFKKGTPAPVIHLGTINEFDISSDLLKIFRNLT